jgi:hypothetical protein
LARRSSWRGRFAPTGDDLDGRDTSGGGHGGRLSNGYRWRDAGDGRLVEQGLGHVGARFILINKTNRKDISKIKYHMLTLMQYYILFAKPK